MHNTPIVFISGKNYQIMFLSAHAPSYACVEVGGTLYYDTAHGAMRFRSPVHRITVPMEALNSAGGYTVCEIPILQRKPYMPDIGETVKTYYSFRPVPSENIRMYHISDVHNFDHGPIQAAKAFGEFDVLIMNGDIPDLGSNIEKYNSLYRISAAITGGQIPVLFSHGNHELLGDAAELYADYIPEHNGNSFYTFRLGNVWGVVLDSGTDAPSHSPVGKYVVNCDQQRMQQTQFLQQIIENAQKEYAAPGVKHRIVISHIPFTLPPEHAECHMNEHFEMWNRLLKEQIKPTVAIHGHLHKIFVAEVQNDTQPCPAVVAARHVPKIFTNGTYIFKNFAGAGFTFTHTAAEIAFTNDGGYSFEHHTLPLNA